MEKIMIDSLDINDILAKLGGSIVVYPQDNCFVAEYFNGIGEIIAKGTGQTVASAIADMYDQAKNNEST